VAVSGGTVFRPDSGDPIKIICGDKSASEGSNERKGVLALLAEIFGYSINTQGYKILNEKVGVIYGDAMYLERYSEMMGEIICNGWASSNLVIGVGGILLQSHSRDDLGFSFKAVYAEIDGKSVEIFKNPITDHGKSSMKGLIKVSKEDDRYKFTDQVSLEEEKQGELSVVFSDGACLYTEAWETIRERVFCS
jgi:nicotinamide phosphoribosyltransferase